MTVGIVGLGAAGLRAAMLFEKLGVDVQLFEARGRPGGRLHCADEGHGTLYEAGGEWIDADHHRVLDLLAEFKLTPTTPAEWESALDRYLNSRNDRPLKRCLEVVQDNDAKTLVIETRYLDVDYRSEYSAYFSRLFAGVPDSAHRLHFFSEQLDESSLWNMPEGVGYLGYIVIRPAHNGPVARALLKPPPDCINAIRTSVTESVSLFGNSLDVTGVPFSQQDTDLGACAHAAAWMCHYTAYLRNEVARKPLASFSLMADASLQPKRSLPSSGLTVEQLSEIFRTFERPAIFYALGQLPPVQLPWLPAGPTPLPAVPPEITPPPPGKWDTRVISTICRYLNSGIPVLVGTFDHAFILCGYQRSAEDPSWVNFYRNDDQRGPYLRVMDALNDVDYATGYAHTPWRTLHVPVPQKVWLSPEAAEQAGGINLQAASIASSPTVRTLYGGEIDDVDALIANNQLALKTYVIPSREFKEQLIDRGVSEAMARVYRYLRMSRYVWVVEAIDRQLRTAGRPCVIGQAIFDATSSDRHPNLLALDIHGLLWNPADMTHPIFAASIPYESGGVGPP